MNHDSKDSSKSTFNSRLTAILQEQVVPILASRGFCKLGHVFENTMTGLSWVLDIQRSRWDDSFESQFTVNCGVFVPGVMPLYLYRPERRRIDTIDCCLHVRLGMLASDGLDKWWKLRTDDDVTVTDDQIAKELSERLTQHAFPFFNRFQNPEQVLKFLTEPRAKEEGHIGPQSAAIAFCYAAAIASLLKRPQDVVECLDNAISASQGLPSEETVLSLRDRVYPN